MGSSSCGLLIKKVLAESEIEQVFGKQLIKNNKEEESSFDYLHDIIHENLTVVVKGLEGTVIFHDMYLFDEYTNSFKGALQKHGGCCFGMSSTSMAASFVHYLAEGIFHDEYLYEAEFTREGPNILGITDNMEFLFENVDELIQKYIGPWDSWSDALFYSLGDELPDYKLFDKLEQVAHNLDYIVTASDRMFDFWAEELLREYNQESDELRNKHRMIRSACAYELAKREIEIHFDFHSYFEGFNKRTEELKYFSLEELQRKKKDITALLPLKKIGLEQLQNFVAIQSVLEKKQVEHEKKQEAETTFNSQVISYREKLNSVEDKYLKFMYLYLHSQLSKEEIGDDKAKLMVKALEQELVNRKLTLPLATRRNETQEYFTTFLNNSSNTEIVFMDHMLSTLGRTEDLIKNAVDFPFIRALLSTFTSRSIEPNAKGITNRLLKKKVVSKDDSKTRGRLVFLVIGIIVLVLLILGICF